MRDKVALVLLVAFVLAFYKIIFSHWVSRLLFIGGVMYMRSSEIFRKKNLDTVTPIEIDYGEHGEDSHVNEHG
jgi:hypothetical protein